MIVRLELPYADVRAGDLVHALGDDPMPALDALTARAGDWDVELRLLGCSHQALVNGGVELSETVSCRPGVPGHLPAEAAGGTRGGHYAFRARVETLDPAGYAARAEAVLADARRDRCALAGLFPAPAGIEPGGPAFTALRLQAAAGQVAWTTWHGYPQTGELVITESRLEARP